MCTDYSNQERIVREEGVTAKVIRTVIRKCILCVCCELLLWQWKRFCRWERILDWSEESCLGLKKKNKSEKKKKKKSVDG